MKLGILLPIFALPSKYGIGDFGYEAYEFIDILKDYNIDYWEILPICASGICPYSPISYYALNENFISLDKLQEMGLIGDVRAKDKSERIKYDNYKEKYYKEAFNNFKIDEEFRKFSKNKNIRQYAEFRHSKTNEEVDYYIFLQYILDKQWRELKDYANQNNIQIIGDLPIYPNYDSCEVFNYPEYYQLKNGKMEYVSGASPDYFNSEGQKWGHPLYDFNKIKVDGYKYLLDRYKEFLERFDVIRIDHFRAFDTYYKIPIDKCAKDGVYVLGPGEDFFDRLFSITTWDRFIVEDLGDIRRETEELRDKYNFTKMKIIQYTIDTDKGVDNYLDKENMVIYTGNHDNNTIVGWFNSLSGKEKENLRNFLRKNDCYNSKIHLGLIKYCLKSKARMAIFPVQDIMGLDERAKINLPGVVEEGNWSFELENFEEFKKGMEEFKELLVNE